ncbi:ferritin-like domain-containing protein [Aggregicoccus sp. 17bor-14]|uniref:ferritin-like domain-containing protein n=1 Tax=Myxococcaceae TaxID=31 RepID=UPI00129C1AC1|nr:MULTISPECIES: ferritin-like domain-containing protein [Myxococcaceae]MBF5042979.1 ferritin-like domain-containing protein [Simulacricoccus sp. 17bor-14]MRI88745.1 ferritin-like domain-containing protein [Aggregicoccus sp. 17bor-14]
MAAHTHSTDTLVSFFQEELAAAQVYEQALSKLEHARARDRLRECGKDHQRRAQLLRERLELLGRTPPDTQGRGTGFSKLSNLGSSDLGISAASVVQSLAEGEEYELQDYVNKLDRLDEESRRFVEEQLLSAQRQTHASVSALHRTLH